VGDEQQDHSSSQTGRAPARLACLIGLLEQRVGILEYVHGIVERDAVFPPVGPRLYRVPLEPHHPTSV
jgi:hypothetical protein